MTIHAPTSPISVRAASGRRRLLAVGATLALAALQALAPVRAEGQPYRLLVGFPAGGGTDAIARVLADRLKDELGAPVLVENKPGAGGQLAAQALKAAPADGHTLFLTHDHTVSILPLVVRTPGFDTARDFVPVAGIATFVNALAVAPGTPAKSVGDWVQWVKGPGGGKGAVGIPAPASVPEFLVKVLAQKYALDLVAAPYRGSAPLMADMMGNQVGAGIASIPDFIEHHRQGKLRVVAVLGPGRQAALPEVPTLGELGLAGFEETPFYGVYAPAGTPAPQLATLGQALAKVVAQPEVRERLGAMGLNVGWQSGTQLGQRERAYAAGWARIIKASGFQPQ